MLNDFLFKDFRLFCRCSWYLGVQSSGCSTDDLRGRIPNNVARGKVDDKKPVVPNAVAYRHDGGMHTVISEVAQIPSIGFDPWKNVVPTRVRVNSPTTSFIAKPSILVRDFPKDFL